MLRNMGKKIETNVNFTKIMGFDFSFLVYVMNIKKLLKNYWGIYKHLQSKIFFLFIITYKMWKKIWICDSGIGIQVMYIIYTC
jgi:hypothetical protein